MDNRMKEDVSEKQQSGSRIKAAEENLKLVVFEWDIKADVITLSPNQAKCYGKISSQEFLSRIHPDDLPKANTFCENIQQGVLYSKSEYRILEGPDSYIWYRVHAIAQYGEDQKPVRAVGIAFDIDGEIKVMDQLRSRAERDGLTGLYNREGTESRIRKFLRSKPAGQCALFMIDTDNFKQINDRNGHMLGDVVLAEMASAMKRIMGEHDIVGRIGGDEFTIFMKQIPSREEAAEKARQLTEVFRHLFENDKTTIQITSSIGVAIYPEDGTDFKTLYQHADQALYQAKSQGKNGYILYDGSHPYEIGTTVQSSLGTAIDSEHKGQDLSNSLLADIIRILYKTEDIDQAINLTLEIVGRWFDVSRAYIFESRDNGRYHINTHEWCNEGISPEIQNLQYVDAGMAGDYKTMFGENSIFYCRDTSLLPPTLRSLLESQGIHSTLQCAYWTGDEFAGFIGFDECTGLRLWNQEEVDILTLISQMITTVLQRGRSVEWNQMMERQLRTVLDAQDSCLYVIDQNTFEILYLGTKIKELKKGIQLGEYCYKALFGKTSPCDFCPLFNGGTGEKDVTEYNMRAQIHASSMNWLGNDAYLISCHAKAGQQTEDEQQKKTEKGIVDCIQWLTNSDYLGDSIEYVLEIIRDYYQADRVYIIEIDDKRGIINNTYEICAEGVEPQRHMLQDLPVEIFTFWMDQFEVRDYIKIDDVEELGEERKPEYEVLKQQGIRSLMAIPLYVEGEMKGFLGADDPKCHKKNFHYLKALSYFLESEIAKNSLKKSLERMSYRDALTDLGSRNSYTMYCDDFAKRMPAPVGILFMDINGLKRLNDLKGHVYGDMLIIHVADRMKQFFPNERKFRLSGDEFLVVTESMTYGEFRKQLDAMQKTLLENGHSVIAIGTTWSDVPTDLNELMGRADRLMHINKQDYYRGADDMIFEKIPLLKDLTKSILNKEYLVYLQPKLNVKTGQVDSAEVLVRYREKDGTILSPIKFVPMLESEGLISNIDFFVMEEVCRLLAKWKGTALEGMRLALNFSRITLFDDHFFDQFWNIFKRYDLRPEQLEVEITETQETLNKKQMAILLNELKQHGFGIALDDFGVEYSSYEFLMMASFDMLKIDKSLVQRYEEAQKGEILMKHIVDMGHDVGMKCCAEGVETEFQFRFIKEIGCDYIQGYLIDRPLSIDQFESKYMEGPAARS